MKLTQATRVNKSQKQQILLNWVVTGHRRSNIRQNSSGKGGGGEENGADGRELARRVFSDLDVPRLSDHFHDRNLSRRLMKSCVLKAHLSMSNFHIFSSYLSPLPSSPPMNFAVFECRWPITTGSRNLCRCLFLLFAVFGPLAPHCSLLNSAGAFTSVYQISSESGCDCSLHSCNWLSRWPTWEMATEARFCVF